MAAMARPEPIAIPAISPELKCAFARCSVEVANGFEGMPAVEVEVEVKVEVLVVT